MSEPRFEPDSSFSGMERCGSNEMVERVAMALSIADGNHPDACSNDEEEIPAWKLYVKDARAAISAMREPPSVRSEPVCPCCGYDGLWPYEPDERSKLFAAMLDQALK